MMNKTMATLALTVFILLPSPSKAIELTFETDTLESQKVQILAKQVWKKWTKEFDVRLTNSFAKVKFVSPAQISHNHALTSGSTIKLNKFLPTSQSRSVIVHELAHLFLAKKCNHMDSRTQEVFAQWASEDYRRLNRDKNAFFYTSEAIKYLAENKAASRDSFAIARLIAVQDSDDLRKKMLEFFRNCKTRLNLFTKNISVPKTEKIDFLVLDGFTLESISKEGSPFARHSTGSILKPLMLVKMPSLMTRIRQRQNIHWACPQYPKNSLKRWTWKEALIRSCNGFFIDGHRLVSKFEKVAWVRTFKEVLDLDVGDSASEAIGLNPAIKLSLSEVLRLYAFIDKEFPGFFDVLKATTLDGTLANHQRSTWFYRRGFKLKSGTIRDEESRPIESWIVAIASSNESGMVPFYAAIRQRGSSTKALLEQLYLRLSSDQSLNKINEARVQVLGLVPQSSIKFGCSQGSLAVKKIGSVFKFLPSTLPAHTLVDKDEIRCFGGNILATIPDSFKAGEVTKIFSGTISVKDLKNLNPDAINYDSKFARARAGSRFILLSSNRSYAFHTLASEFPRGRMETLKTLAQVVSSNLKIGRHGGRPICDTTHCQVFSQNHHIGGVLAARLKKAVDFSLSKQLNSTKWIPFSIGGLKPWKTTLKNGRIESRLDLPGEILEIELTRKDLENTVALSFKNYPKFLMSCEKFRNELKLQSCPDQVSHKKNSSEFVFQGRGSGHGLGLDLSKAEVLSAKGFRHIEILEKMGIGF